MGINAWQGSRQELQCCESHNVGRGAYTWVRYGLLRAIHSLGIMGCLPISHPSLTSNYVSQLGEMAASTIPGTEGKQGEVRSTSNAAIWPVTEFQLMLSDSGDSSICCNNKNSKDITIVAKTTIAIVLVFGSLHFCGFMFGWKAIIYTKNTSSFSDQSYLYRKNKCVRMYLRTCTYNHVVRSLITSNFGVIRT